MPSQKAETLEIQKFTHIRKKSKIVFTLPKQKFLKNFLYSTETKISKMFLFTQSKCFLKCFFYIYPEKVLCIVARQETSVIFCLYFFNFKNTEEDNVCKEQVVELVRLVN